LKLLGTSIIPQHSDARLLDQLIYKWDHSRKIIAHVLADKYTDLIDSGWRITSDAITRDARLLFEGNFTEFLSRQEEFESSALQGSAPPLGAP
jgi:hypothetical protein